MTEFEKQLLDYRLTTAQILYHMPDHPALLQLYVWQQYDVAPRFPELTRFLNFWESNIEGRIHSVQMTSSKIIQPAQIRHFPHGWQLH